MKNYYSYLSILFIVIGLSSLDTKAQQGPVKAKKQVEHTRKKLDVSVSTAEKVVACQSEYKEKLKRILNESNLTEETPSYREHNAVT